MWTTDPAWFWTIALHQRRPSVTLVMESSYEAFLVAAVILIVTPGPDMLFIAAIAARGGPAVGLSAALGTSAGLAVRTAGAVLGLAALLSAVPVLHELLRWVGVAYLLYLAVRAFRENPLADEEVVAAGDAFWRGFLVDVLNPKSILFFVAFLPQFVAADRGHLHAQFLVLGVTFVLLDLLVDGTVGLVSGRLGRNLRHGRRFTRGLGALRGTIFTALAVRLATT
jgi:threonine/homoserine/homoserine lactone efflux protein